MESSNLIKVQSILARSVWAAERGLKNFSLKVDQDFSDIHSICLYLKKSNNNYIKKNYKSINFNYSKKLNKNIEKVINLIKKNKCIVHGACNSLNNIISWTSKIYDFHLIDNDQNKIGKIFFPDSLIIDKDNRALVISAPTHNAPKYMLPKWFLFLLINGILRVTDLDDISITLGLQ